MCGHGTNKSSFRTKKNLATAFEKLLDSHSFDAVTVKKLVDECDYSRQTFYRHFADKYDLVLWIYQEVVQDTVQRIGEDLSWFEAVVTKLEIMRSKQSFYSEVYKSNDYNALIVRDADIVHAYYVENIERLTGNAVPFRESFLLKFYAIGATRSTALWARTGMKEDPRLLAELYGEMLPSFAKEIFFNKTATTIHFD